MKDLANEKRGHTSLTDDARQGTDDTCAERLYEKGLIPDICRNFTDEELVQDLHHIGFSNGLYLGYLYGIKDLIDSGASFETVFSLIKLIPERTLLHHNNFEESEELIDRLVKEIDAYVDAKTIYAER